MVRVGCFLGWAALLSSAINTGFGQTPTVPLTVEVYGDKNAPLHGANVR